MDHKPRITKYKDHYIARYPCGASETLDNQFKPLPRGGKRVRVDAKCACAVRVYRKWGGGYQLTPHGAHECVTVCGLICKVQ